MALSNCRTLSVHCQRTDEPSTCSAICTFHVPSKNPQNATAKYTNVDLNGVWYSGPSWIAFTIAEVPGEVSSAPQCTFYYTLHRIQMQ